jgi:hypothetical protein
MARETRVSEGGARRIPTVRVGFRSETLEEISERIFFETWGVHLRDVLREPRALPAPTDNAGEKDG